MLRMMTSRRPLQLLRPRGHVDAVQLRHADVEDERRRAVLLAQAQRLEAVGRFGRRRSGPARSRAGSQPATHDAVIVSQQHAQARPPPSSAGSGQANRRRRARSAGVRLSIDRAAELAHSLLDARAGPSRSRRRAGSTPTPSSVDRRPRGVSASPRLRRAMRVARGVPDAVGQRLLDHAIDAGPMRIRQRVEVARRRSRSTGTP